MNRAWQFLKEKCLNCMETDRLTTCGKLTLLARLDVNWPPPEELADLVFMYKIDSLPK